MTAQCSPFVFASEGIIRHSGPLKCVQSLEKSQHVRGAQTNLHSNAITLGESRREGELAKQISASNVNSPTDQARDIDK